MQQISNDFPQPQWKKLTSDINGEKPPTDGHRKLLFSQDHLILLMSQESVAYTFQLKNLYWTKHNIDNRQSTISMTSNSCVARPGLILDLNFNSSPSLELLTFDTEKVPKNFCRTSKSLKNLSNLKALPFTITADPFSIYLFGFTKLAAHKSLSNALYRVDIESCEISEVIIEGTRPPERLGHLAAFYHERLFIFGGKDKHQRILSDLWVFDLSEKKWSQLDDGRESLFSKGVESFFAQEDQILLCSYQDGISLTRGFSLSDLSWKILSSRIPESSSAKFVVYENSMASLCGSDVYSLMISNKVKKCSEKQSDDFIVKMFQDKTFADVIFQVEDQEFHANKCFLSVRCPYFKNVFTSNMMESQNKAVAVKDIRAEVFKVMLEYLYFIEVEVKCDIAEDLFKLSHEYRLQNLQNDCEELLTRDIQVKNVIEKIQFAKIYEASRLRKACLNFIVKNLDRVFLTQNIHELDKETLLELHKIKV